MSLPLGRDETRSTWLEFCFTHRYGPCTHCGTLHISPLWMALELQFILSNQGLDYAVETTTVDIEERFPLHDRLFTESQDYCR